MAIALARHRDMDSVPPEFALIVDGAILATTIRVANQALLWKSSGQGLAESRKGEAAVQAITHRPADDTAGRKINDHSQVKPALPGSCMGNTFSPFLVRPGVGEILVREVRSNRPSMLGLCPGCRRSASLHQTLSGRYARPITGLLRHHQGHDLPIHLAQGFLKFQVCDLTLSTRWKLGDSDERSFLRFRSPWCRHIL